MRAQEEDVAGRRLDREVLVDRADRHAVGIEHHPVVAGLGDGAPPLSAARRAPRRARSRPFTASRWRWAPRGRGRSRPPMAAPPPRRSPGGQLGVGSRACAPARTSPRRRAPRRQATSATSCWARMSSGATGGSRRRADPPAPPRGGPCTRRARHASSDRAGRPACRRGGGWPAPPAGGTCRWPGASRSGRRARPARRRCPARARPLPPGPQVAGAQARLDDAPPRHREAARGARRRAARHPVVAVRRLVLPEPLRQQMGDPLGHLAGVDEDERRPVRGTCARDPVEDLATSARRSHRLELGGRELDRHVEVAGVPTVDDDRGWSVVVHAGQQARPPGRGDAGWPRGRCAGATRRSRSPVRRGARGSAPGDRERRSLQRIGLSATQRPLDLVATPAVRRARRPTTPRSSSTAATPTTSTWPLSSRPPSSRR